MSTWFCAVAVCIAIAGAIGVVAFESSTRSAGGLLTAFVGGAAIAGVIGAPLVSGFVLWVGGGGIGLLLLAAVLLLNLGEDERGRRRLRVRPALVIPVLGLLWSALTAPLLAALPSMTGASGLSPAAPMPAPTAEAVAMAMVDDLALPFTVALVAIAGALVVAVALVRRRA